ncbi:Uncharacterized protein FWK35_00024085 [Aphis craccivora]|uniref:Uncharacterized protein n=1 Tax=Aphis craccivora TaxID=307492 RepID=A0A6G0VVB9_APHCR|nr:Uncharacterized protein FWK35_00030860 [Aphis craccivora]KAF0728270.1 Uncharacterized protein FWK35_00024085 [Aphis craccivora]
MGYTHIIQRNLTPKSVPINKWRLKNPNWNLFSTLVDYALQNSVTDEDTHITCITQNKIDKLTLNLTNYHWSSHSCNRKIRPSSPSQNSPLVERRMQNSYKKNTKKP